MELVEWACPKCGANESSDLAFICECERDFDEDEVDGEHGISYVNPCPSANCYACGWGGKFPKLPLGLKAWEKTALAAGWTMPANRTTELATLKVVKSK
jgi:hypothetical protein